MASYLQVENISKSYGPKVLFDKISFNINEGDKIALIAPNGTGKTSLLKILAGKDSSDRGGEIKYLKDIVTAFLEQETWCNPAHTLLEEVMSHAKGVKGRNANEWDLELNAVQILTELGLGDTSRLVEGLSGGELKRVALASVLVQDADFIVMDEPTNHLDLDA
ncbi:MAG: ABC-F family ATP-binding cassette domain-containing protein, partial [Bacteroidales bacterium]|nr:ABC-F family ATP-binding cassette domain-containing protein [Bacteroidales bacterium]